MDNLLCEETLLLSPFSPEPLPNFRHGTYNGNVGAMSPAISVVTVDEAITMDLEKELRLSNHGDKFMEFFVSKKLTDARFQAVRWLIQTRSRLNLSFETVFSAANCFDRFVYVTSCGEWTNWMVELVAVTSLSIASKFNEVTTPSLHELQMEGLNHMFHHKTVLEMELIMLKALEWCVNSVTMYSFSETLVSKVGMVGDHMMMHQITNHLLNDICDLKMLQYPPTVVAVAALWDVLDQEKIVREDKLGRVMIFFGQEHKEKIVQCVDVMKSRNNDHWSSRRNDCEVKSVLSLLQRGQVMKMMKDEYDVKELCAIFQILRSEGSDKKRERENHQDNIRPAKRMTIFMSN